MHCADAGIQRALVEGGVRGRKSNISQVMMACICVAAKGRGARWVPVGCLLGAWLVLGWCLVGAVTSGEPAAQPWWESKSPGRHDTWRMRISC